MTCGQLSSKFYCRFTRDGSLKGRLEVTDGPNGVVDIQSLSSQVDFQPAGEPSRLSSLSLVAVRARLSYIFCLRRIFRPFFNEMSISIKTDMYLCKRERRSFSGDLPRGFRVRKDYCVLFLRAKLLAHNLLLQSSLDLSNIRTLSNCNFLGPERL